LPADGNRNGVVDIADYTLWRDNFGASFGSASAAATSHDGALSSDVALEPAEPAVDVARALAIAIDSAGAPKSERAISISSSGRSMVLQATDRLIFASPLVHVSDDDLLLLAVATMPPAATSMERAALIAEVTGDESSVDEAFAELVAEVDAWE
jgi:hypothetical protein